MEISYRFLPSLYEPTDIIVGGITSGRQIFDFLPQLSHTLFDHGGHDPDA
jgi:hypothetical protein